MTSEAAGGSAVDVAVLPDELLGIVLGYLDDDDVLQVARLGLPAYSRALVQHTFELEHAVENLKKKASATGQALQLLVSSSGGDNVFQLDVSWLLATKSLLVRLSRSSGVRGTIDDGRNAVRAGPVCIVSKKAGAKVLKPPSPGQVPELLEEMFAELNARLDSGVADVDALCELVGFAYWRLVNIHPFLDGNGRCAHVLAWTVATRALAKNAGLQTRCVPELSAAVDGSLTKWLDFRRHEFRPELIHLLREADAAQGGGSEAVGLLFVKKIWHIPKKRLVGSIRCYRWRNDMGGGDYSTGITWLTPEEASRYSEITGETMVERGGPKGVVEYEASEEWMMEYE